MRELGLESFDGEVWIGVEGFENHLQVSNFGRIKRLASNTLKWNTSKLGTKFLHNTKVTEKILKQSVDRCGYKRIRSQVDGDRFGEIVHRLVAKAFIPNTENKPCVNHKDGDKLNNNVSNLEWVTYAENNRHCKEVLGKQKQKSGSLSCKYKGDVLVFRKTDDVHIDTLKGNIDMKMKGYDYRLVNAVLLGKRNFHRDCYFVRDESTIQIGD